MAHTLDDVPAHQRDDLRDAVADLRHDLGKYVAFQLRWLPPEPSDDELRDALRSDLARTRAAGERVESAVQLWGRLRPAFVGQAPIGDAGLIDLTDDLDLQAVDAAVARIAQLLPGLDDAHRPQLDELRELALAISSATRQLQRRVRAL